MTSKPALIAFVVSAEERFGLRVSIAPSSIFERPLATEMHRRWNRGDE